MLKVDEPGDDGFHALHQLEVTGNYKYFLGGKNLSLNGLNIEVISKDRLRIFMVNH
jgi:hypothetical protein